MIRERLDGLYFLSNSAIDSLAGWEDTADVNQLYAARSFLDRLINSIEEGYDK